LVNYCIVSSPRKWAHTTCPSVRPSFAGCCTYKLDRTTGLHKTLSLTVVLVLCSAGEAQLADTTQQSAPVHRHAPAKSNSRLSDDHMHLDSSPRKRNRKEMSHNKMLGLVCFSVFGLCGLLSDSPPTWFSSYSSKYGQAGPVHSFKAKQEHDRSKAGAQHHQHHLSRGSTA